MRRLLAAGLACLSALFLVLAAVAWWTSATALDTQRFVAVVGPVIDQPAVRAALTTSIAGDVTTIVGQPALASPLRSEVGTVVDGPGFHAVWYAALTVAHRDVVAALTGPGGPGLLVGRSDGTVSVDLIQVVSQVLQALPGSVTSLLGHGRALNSSPGQTSAQVRAQVAAYLGRPLPTDFATVPVASATTLGHARTAVQAIDGAVVVLTAVGLLFALAALVVSVRRRHTIGQVALWGAVFTALAYLGLQAVSRLAAGAVPAGPVNAAVTAVVHALFDSLWVPTVVICVTGVVLALLGYVPRRGR